MTRLLALAALLLAAAPAQPKPALWAFGDADTTVYLLGTVHFLPKDARWSGPALDRAIARADRLVLELVVDDPGSEDAALMATLGRGEGLPPLAERVPPAKRAELAALMGRAKLAPGSLDGLKTWAAAMVLTIASLPDIGLSPGTADGVEKILSRRFRADGRPIEGLETAAAQLAAFDGLPEAAQRRFLAGTIESPAEARREFDGLVGAWAKGDVAAIQRLLDQEPEFTPEMREALLRRRNRAWTEALVRALARPGTVLVAVGAGHLVGPDAVQAMLAARGVRVRRVE